MKTKASTPAKRFIPQLKVADMLSMAGAGLIGLGFGAGLHEHLELVIPVFIILGIIFHGLGMYGKYEIEREHVEPPAWVLIFFGLGSMIFMLSALFILIGRYIVVI